MINFVCYSNKIDHDKHLLTQTKVLSILNVMMNIEEEQQALLKRAAEERELIFNRYSLGLDPTNQVDPWENPKYEIYHITDK